MPISYSLIALSAASLSSVEFQNQRACEAAQQWVAAQKRLVSVTCLPSAILPDDPQPQVRAP
jgi:hypothetical protein